MENQTTEAIAAVPDEAADIARKLLDQIVAAHASCAANAAELGEPYSAHPISIEGDARAIVAAVTPILLAQLQGRLDTAEGRVAHFAAQHQPHDNLFKTCRSCKDGYGDPLPWPCADAVALGLGREATDE
jgi:hypothetical protein